jgi:phosphopantothenoylcysteine decarboxylase/phosphopantothenate--cysteine ligase
MNDRMWAHPQTGQNVTHLRSLRYQVLDPDTGELAVGEGSGPGRMPEPEMILTHVARLLESRGVLAGKRVVVTGGPTREPMDPVRFISNRSSGRMGIALAAAAWRRGAEVILIHGPVSVQLPDGICRKRVESAEEMRDAVAAELPAADVLVMAAAPADFRPASVAGSKIKKAKATPEVELTPTPDILRETEGARRAGMLVVGFALETDDLLANARAKLEAKKLDLVVLNDAREPGAGFEVETNRVTLIGRDGNATPLELMSKDSVADAIVDRIEELLGGR